MFLIAFTINNANCVTGIFTVMCYNVLCDKYATRQMYGYCPSWALEWDYRKKGILDEIRHYSADIISLQASIYIYCLPISSTCEYWTRSHYDVSVSGGRDRPILQLLFA